MPGLLSWKHGVNEYLSWFVHGYILQWEVDKVLAWYVP